MAFLFHSLYDTPRLVPRMKQNTSTEGCSKLQSPETRQVPERLVSTLEHMKREKGRDLTQSYDKKPLSKSKLVISITMCQQF